MKKLIKLQGNSFSGKTTLAEAIHSKWHDFIIFSIDQYRIKYSDGSLDGEMYAWERMALEAGKTDHVILDSTGLSKRLNMIRSDKTFNILVYTGSKTCIMRYTLSKRQPIPFPYNFSTYEQSIIQMENILRYSCGYPDLGVLGSEEKYKDFISIEDALKDERLINFVEKY